MAIKGLKTNRAKAACAAALAMTCAAAGLSGCAAGQTTSEASDANASGQAVEAAELVDAYEALDEGVTYEAASAEIGQAEELGKTFPVALVHVKATNGADAARAVSFDGAPVSASQGDEALIHVSWAFVEGIADQDRTTIEPGQSIESVVAFKIVDESAPLDVTVGADEATGEDGTTSTFELA